MRNTLFLFILTTLAVSQTYPQTPKRVINGLITCDQSGPLEGVTVAVKGENIVSGSQQDGMYYIEVPAKDSVLVFRLDEYRTAEIKLAAGSEYNVVLTRVSNGSVGSQAGIADSTPTADFSAIGNWRGVFSIRPGVDVPFNFEVSSGRDGATELFFRNAGESFEGGPVRQTGDSLIVSLDQFDNELAFRIADGTLSGVLRRQDKTGQPLAVTAERGPSYRFKETGIPPARDISGTYDITFTSANGKEERSVGIFRQQGAKLTATFLHITGDSRFLEGVVEGNSFRLSSFIGSGPSFYTGSFTPDGRLTGEIIGVRGGQSFTGVPNATAALPDPYKLTWLKEGYTSFDFSFPDVDGNKVSLQDAKFRDKVVIVTIGGTWCPNCIDETAFLAPWYIANRSRGIEVVSIQYERQTDSAFVRKVLTRMRDRYDIRYDQVIGGLSDKQVVAASLPSLNTFLAFPTTIFIDRKGRVAKIHTGFTGPATGKYYQDFIKEFNEEIDSLIK
jgi:peroxiredoxin